MVLLRITKHVTAELEMPLNATIYELKREIEARFDVEVAKQTLCHGDVVLEDDSSIGSYNFEELTNLELSVTPDHAPPLAPKFSILVCSCTKEMEVNVRETHTVAHLKEKLERRWGVFHGNISLIHASREMEDDDHTLSEYGVSEGSEIEFVLTNVEAR
ncbi:conserved hypothetical protein [Ricinus communis]|uniref:Ubiquitin-like domain-containing protein n=1 Tax=Ricinus communis TaxID=3988 RepID=B9SZL6_RICCO|nr:conserved hypothetical protein [Ricinus communis]